MSISDIPTNLYSWAIGSIAMTLFGIRSLKRWRVTANPMSRYFGWFAILVGITMGFYGWPGFFTSDVRWLRLGYLVGSLFFYISLTLQARILWFVALKRWVRYRWLLFITIALDAFALANEIPSSRVSITDKFLHYHYSAWSGNTVGLMLVALVLPLSVVFLNQAIHSHSLKAKLKSLGIGLVYVVVGSSTFNTAVIYHGSDAPSTGTVDLLGFSVLLIVMLIPHRGPKIPLKEFPRSLPK